MPALHRGDPGAGRVRDQRERLPPLPDLAGNVTMAPRPWRRSRPDAVDREPAADIHLRMLVERLVRDGRSEREIEAAVRAAERH